nr:MAG TPA: hypothetical protein [Caudoviricetes sp.]
MCKYIKLNIEKIITDIATNSKDLFNDILFSLV